MPSTNQDKGASMEGSQELGPMKKMLIFAGLDKPANLVVAVEDARLESEDSRFSLEKKFFHHLA
jgi:hypothetical protein